jgi:hypothetical protein
MPTIDNSHQFTPECARRPVRHSHDYKPAPGMPQRCSCGHTRWYVTAGGISAPAVCCLKCTSKNRVSSAYEQGRADGFTAAQRKESAPV